MKEDVSVKVKLNPSIKSQINNTCNKITYGIARQTLDLTLPHIPLYTGKLRKTSMGAGVRGSETHYYIGSYTDYAKKVWNKPKGTNWSEPNTFAKWYEVIWEKKRTDIIENSTRRYGLK